jgi:amino acid adenylation domain-containing protein
MSMATLLRDVAWSYPDKDALVDERHRYTFAELDGLSAGFAAFLLSRGVKKGDRIAFCAPKSAPLVVAILGCLRAGAVYVPVDCKLPKERLLFILNDIAARHIVASRELYDAVAANLVTASGLIDEGQLRKHCQHRRLDAALPAIAPEDVAYCIYTSGSTGRPKGVLIEHGSVDAFYRALAEIMPIGLGSRCMNTSELHFDVHVMDLFFPLHRGATVHLTAGPIVANKLLRTIEEERITHFTAVGPIMTLLARGSFFDKCDLSSLVRIMTGAEIINVDTVQAWLRRVPGLSLVNGYGPTEATVICTAHIIDRVEPGRTDFYPIGKPMRGTEVMLFAEGGAVSEPGVRGELLIGGPQVMKGYWNNPQQTSERLVVIAGRLFYRSGDICKWRPDGNLDYVGRTDDEIKLSGFRIDLNEIKRVMDATPSVREGHFVVTAHPTLGKIIVACFTRADDAEADDAKAGDAEAGDAEAGDAGAGDGVFARLQAAFKRELPYYMVPSLYFLFDRFPTLPSGKTDKKEILHRVNRRICDADLSSTRFVCSEGAPG